MKSDEEPKSVRQGLRTLAYWASEDGDYKPNFDYAHKVFQLYKKNLRKARMKQWDNDRLFILLSKQKGVERKGEKR